MQGKLKQVRFTFTQDSELATSKADVWSFACVVFELILGEHPYQVRKRVFYDAILC